MRGDQVAGLLLAAATVAALVVANSPAAPAYDAAREASFGPSAIGLHLSVGHWAADGLLAVFFFVVGLELRREFTRGELRDPRRAAPAIAGAVGGVVVPALVYVAVVTIAGVPALHGWAIPTATDIAFALAVLGLVGRGLPPALRVFLLTLAVVDDLLAVTIIAVGYTDDVQGWALAAAVVPLVLFALATGRGITHPLVLVPLALLAWTLVHASGVHATVAGVALGLCAAAGPTADRLEHVVRPFSNAVAIPVFAFFSAGVTVGGITGLRQALSDPVAIAIMLGLVVGKAVGITVAALLAARLGRTGLGDGVRPWDVAAVALLAGIGFTVALLVGDLAFGHSDTVTIAILSGSLLAAGLGSAALRVRARAHARPVAGHP
ncbi:Na+/H+ antiporter NhaA [Isoptericola sp. NPDC019693]|uniref:Na+/H+ antiporter NhaA n=1 Tax=Isoptericola sp. NPDC019693 TaxID=3364009 RepID=UPI0037B7AFA3